MLHNGRYAAIEAHARQMRSEELRRLFGLAVSALSRGASRLVRIGAAAAKGLAAGVHAALIEKDRERSSIQSGPRRRSSANPSHAPSEVKRKEREWGAPEERLTF